MQNKKDVIVNEPIGAKHIWKNLNLAILFIVVLACIAMGLIWHEAKHNNKTANTVNNNIKSPTNSQIGDSQNKAASKAISRQDYSSAVQSYLLASSVEQSSRNYSQAKQTLQTAITNIPDSQTPYTIYDSLYSVAAAIGDKQLEVSSLKTAIAKAQQPGSGAPDGLVDFYNQQLKGLE